MPAIRTRSAAVVLLASISFFGCAGTNDGEIDWPSFDRVPPQSEPPVRDAADD